MKLLEPARELNVINEVDVCVVGGSCTGVFAAVRAAQMGMRVAIIEKQNSFGGVATSGLVHAWHSFLDTEYKNRVIGGLSEQIINELKKRNVVVTHPNNPDLGYSFNSEEMKIELDKMIVENAVTPYLHTMFCAPVIEDGKLTHIIIENKNGRSAISARFFIDASGDGDLCRRIGTESYIYDAIMPPTMCARIMGIEMESDEIGPLLDKYGTEYGLVEDWGWRALFPNTENIRLHAEQHVFDTNCADADMLTESEIEGRRKVRAFMDIVRRYSDEKGILLALPSYIGIRDTYHVKSLHCVTSDEILYGARFEDAILNGTYRVDVHHSGKPGVTLKYLDGRTHTTSRTGAPQVGGRWREETDENPLFYQIPYKSIVPVSQVDNLLYCGRMIDAEKDAFSALRVMVNTNQMGEPAGVAAGLAVKAQCSAKDVDTNMLRSRLSEFGAIVI